MSLDAVKAQSEIEEVGRFYEQVFKINKEYMNYWMEHSLWAWDFWLSLILAVLPWTIWLGVRKKDSQGRLLIAGFLMLIISSWFDFLGVAFGFWYYAVDIIPTIPSYFPWDFAIFPVLTMLLIQYRPNLNPWIKAVAFSSFNSFLGEPIMEWLGLYVSLKWSCFYSFPIYIILYMLCHHLAHLQVYRAID